MLIVEIWHNIHAISSIEIRKNQNIKRHPMTVKPKTLLHYSMPYLLTLCAFILSPGCVTDTVIESCSEVQLACIEAGRCIEATSAGSSDTNVSLDTNGGSGGTGSESECDFKCIPCGDEPNSTGQTPSNSTASGGSASGGGSGGSCSGGKVIDPNTGYCACPSGTMEYSGSCKSISDAEFLIGAWSVSVVASFSNSGTTLRLDGSFVVGSNDLEFGSSVETVRTSSSNPPSVSWHQLEVDGEIITGFDIDANTLALTYLRASQRLQFGAALGGAWRVTWLGEFDADQSLTFSPNAAGVVSGDGSVNILTAEANAINPNSTTVTLQKR